MKPQREICDAEISSKAFFALEMKLHRQIQWLKPIPRCVCVGLPGVKAFKKETFVSLRLFDLFLTLMWRKRGKLKESSQEFLVQKANVSCWKFCFLTRHSTVLLQALEPPGIRMRDPAFLYCESGFNMHRPSLIKQNQSAVTKILETFSPK